MKNIYKEISVITRELGYLQREGRRESGGKTFSFHGENGVRDVIKQKLLEHDIHMLVTEIETEIITSNSSAAGNRIYSTMQVKASLRVELHKDDEIQIFHISACDVGDEFSNASSSAITLAIRNWMKALFQITYDPAEEEEVEEKPPSLEMSAKMANDAKLMISRASIAEVKSIAKGMGYSPSSWNLAKMTQEDLFHCASIAMTVFLKSSQADTLDKVSEEIEHE
jgi:hypothetical protein